MIYVDPNLLPADRAKKIEEVANALSTLAGHPGWVMLDTYLAQEQERVFLDMQRATTGEMMLKAASAFATIKNIRELPAKISRSYIDELRQLAKK